MGILTPPLSKGPVIRPFPHTDIFGGIPGSGSTDNAKLDPILLGLGLDDGR